jgi:L,D-peptidoglycan transpeptidase YkuD (ErfK/YbiS/YcfS/YnhG family)
VDARHKAGHDDGNVILPPMRLILLLLTLLTPAAALAQSCPAPLARAHKLVLVVPDDWTSTTASLQRFTRRAPNAPWQPDGGVMSALVGKSGSGWSFAFRQFGLPGEPEKREGDKRAPAGFFNISHSFGFAPSTKPGYLQLTRETVCVSDVRSSAYNRIAARGVVGQDVRAERMGYVPEYARGLLVDYPTRPGGGSCIFIHIRKPTATGTGGCVALPEPQLASLQDFAQGGAVLAMVPKPALMRFRGCLPQ